MVEMGVQSNIPLCTMREWILVGRKDEMKDSVRAREVARVPPR